MRTKGKTLYDDHNNVLGTINKRDKEWVLETPSGDTPVRVKIQGNRITYPTYQLYAHDRLLTELKRSFRKFEGTHGITVEAPFLQQTRTILQNGERLATYKPDWWTRRYATIELADGLSNDQRDLVYAMIVVLRSMYAAGLFTAGVIGGTVGAVGTAGS